MLVGRRRGARAARRALGQPAAGAAAVDATNTVVSRSVARLARAGVHRGVAVATALLFGTAPAFAPRGWRRSRRSRSTGAARRRTRRSALGQQAGRRAGGAVAGARRRGRAVHANVQSRSRRCHLGFERERVLLVTVDAQRARLRRRGWRCIERAPRGGGRRSRRRTRAAVSLSRRSAATHGTSDRRRPAVARWPRAPSACRRRTRSRPLVRRRIGMRARGRARLRRRDRRRAAGRRSSTRRSSRRS